MTSRLATAANDDPPLPPTPPPPTAPFLVEGSSQEACGMLDVRGLPTFFLSIHRNLFLLATHSQLVNSPLLFHVSCHLFAIYLHFVLPEGDGLIRQPMSKCPILQTRWEIVPLSSLWFPRNGKSSYFLPRQLPSMATIKVLPPFPQ